tara:strand:- start:654 stop:857 length:204 start_codon:yes stop_codon:yes gene_type:complete
MAKAESPTTDRDWEVEDAARTLLKAEEIKKDKKLYPLAIKELEKQQTALAQALGSGKTLMRAINKED